MKRFKLIPSQTFLIKILAQNDDLKTCAQLLGISNNCLKKRIECLYKKFNVNSLKDLIHKLVDMQLLSQEVVNKDIYYKSRHHHVKNEEICKEAFMQLTSQEKKYLFLVAHGHTAKEIKSLMQLQGIYHCRSIRNSICCKLRISRIKFAGIEFLKLIYQQLY